MSVAAQKHDAMNIIRTNKVHNLLSLCLIAGPSIRVLNRNCPRGGGY